MANWKAVERDEHCGISCSWMIPKKIQTNTWLEAFRNLPSPGNDPQSCGTQCLHGTYTWTEPIICLECLELSAVRPNSFETIHLEPPLAARTGPLPALPYTWSIMGPVLNLQNWEILECTLKPLLLRPGTNEKKISIAIGKRNWKEQSASAGNWNSKISSFSSHWEVGEIWSWLLELSACQARSSQSNLKLNLDVGMNDCLTSNPADNAQTPTNHTNTILENQEDQQDRPPFMTQTNTNFMTPSRHI